MSNSTVLLCNTAYLLKRNPQYLKFELCSTDFAQHTKNSLELSRNNNLMNFYDNHKMFPSLILLYLWFQKNCLIENSQKNLRWVKIFEIIDRYFLWIYLVNFRYLFDPECPIHKSIIYNHYLTTVLNFDISKC